MTQTDQKYWRRLATEISAGHFAYETLRQRGTDVLIARAKTEKHGTVICKLWNRPGVKGGWRRVTRTGTAWRECRALERLHQRGLPVPCVFGLVHLSEPVARHTVCLVVEDLGDCEDATEHLKQLIRSGDKAAEAQFNKTLIRTTSVLIDCNLLDVDHRLPNFVRPPGKPPTRLDFELAQHVFWRPLHWRQYGQMLGTLLGSYIFAVQPDEVRMQQFARDLIAALNPGMRVLRVAASRIQGMLERQKRESGIDTTFTPSWGL